MFLMSFISHWFNYLFISFTLLEVCSLGTFHFCLQWILVFVYRLCERICSSNKLKIMLLTRLSIYKGKQCICIFDSWSKRLDVSLILGCLLS
jgi:hypothetical protein